MGNFNPSTSIIKKLDIKNKINKEKRKNFSFIVKKTISFLDRSKARCRFDNAFELWEGESHRFRNMSMTFSLLPTSFSRWTFGIPFHPRPLCRKSFLSRRRFVLKAETGKTSQNATSVKAMNSKASRLETETAADVKETIPFGSHGEAWLMAIAFAFCSVLFPPIQLTGLFCTIGWICCLTGTVLLINGLFTMGRNNFPFPSPRENAEFIKKGIYASVRHPQYGGCLLFCLGLCFLTRNEVVRFVLHKNGLA